VSVKRERRQQARTGAEFERRVADDMYARQEVAFEPRYRVDISRAVAVLDKHAGANVGQRYRVIHIENLIEPGRVVGGARKTIQDDYIEADVGVDDLVLGLAQGIEDVQIPGDRGERTCAGQVVKREHAVAGGVANGKAASNRHVVEFGRDVAL